MIRTMVRGLNAGPALAALAVATAMSTAIPARADDLQGALAAAYATNPDLAAARANQRATDEGVPIARAAALPSLSGTANYTEFLRQGPNSFLAPKRAFQADTTLSVPVYAGGAVKNALLAAKTRVEAGQAGLRGTEASVFSQVVAAYMDVIRDAATVGLNRNNVAVLEVNLKATSDRFEIGDVTRTDVAQSNSRLALARADLRSAEAALVASRERYVQVVGKTPDDLLPPPPLAGLPAAPEEAVQVALDSNPDLIAAHERSKAAGYDAKAAGAGRLPQVSLFTTGPIRITSDRLAVAALPEEPLCRARRPRKPGCARRFRCFRQGCPPRANARPRPPPAPRLSRKFPPNVRSLPRCDLPIPSGARPTM